MQNKKCKSHVLQNWADLPSLHDFALLSQIKNNIIFFSFGQFSKARCIEAFMFLEKAYMGLLKSLAL